MPSRFTAKFSGRKVFFSGLLLFILLGACFPVEVSARDDWQYWNSFEVKKEIGEDWTLRGSSEQRLRDDFSDLYTYNFDGGFLWQPAKNFEIGPFFRYEHEKNARGRHSNELRWFLESTLKGTWKKWSFSERSRLGYRDFNAGSDHWRYRNRIKISYPLQFGKFKFSPYFSEEIFWNLRSSELNQNRMSGGVTTRLTKNLSMSTYYMWRARKTGGNWDDEHILGTGLAVHL